MYMEAHGSKTHSKFISEFIDELAETLNAKVIMPVYPKIPHQDYQATYVLLKSCTMIY